MYNIINKWKHIISKKGELLYETFRGLGLTKSWCFLFLKLLTEEKELRVKKSKSYYQQNMLLLLLKGND